MRFNKPVRQITARSGIKPLITIAHRSKVGIKHRVVTTPATKAISTYAFPMCEWAEDQIIENGNERYRYSISKHVISVYEVIRGIACRLIACEGDCDKLSPSLGIGCINKILDALNKPYGIGFTFDHPLEMIKDRSFINDKPDTGYDVTWIANIGMLASDDSKFVSIYSRWMPKPIKPVWLGVKRIPELIRVRWNYKNNLNRAITEFYNTTNEYAQEPVTKFRECMQMLKTDLEAIVEESQS